LLIFKFSGIGRAIALLFAQQGAKVVCSDISAESRGEPVATHDQIKQNGGHAIFVKADVTQEAEVSELVQTAVREYGRLDIMCNNAGIAIESKKHSSIWECEEESFNLSFDVNAKGVFLGCKHASKVMKEQEPGSNGDRGWIVNTGSIMSLQALPGTSKYLQITREHAHIQ
jgi:NAD(P)-dependent dehydrogenase (short-subunit alcohol dehydrogenase family)